MTRPPGTERADPAEISFLADRPEFLDVLAPWLHEEWGHLDPANTLEARRQKLRREMKRDELDLALVAHREDTLLGVASLRAHDLETRPELSPWIGGVFVAPEHRGRGIGSLLVRSVEERARELGIDRLHLFTEDRVSFYRARGWSVVEEDVYRGHDIVIMDKELSPSS